MFAQIPLAEMQLQETAKETGSWSSPEIKGFSVAGEMENGTVR